MIDIQEPVFSGSTENKVEQITSYISQLQQQLDSKFKNISMTDLSKDLADRIGGNNLNINIDEYATKKYVLAHAGGGGGDEYTEIASNSTTSLYTPAELYQMYQAGVKMKYLGYILHYANVGIDYDDNVTYITMSRQPYGEKVHQYVYCDTLNLDVILINSSKVISITSQYNIKAGAATFTGALTAYSLTARLLSGSATPSTSTASLEISASGIRAQLGVKNSRNYLHNRIYMSNGYFSFWNSTEEKSLLYPELLKIPEVCIDKISLNNYQQLEFDECGMFLTPTKLIFDDYGLVASGTYGRFLVTHDTATFPGARWIKIQREMVTEPERTTSIAATLKIDFENQSITWE